MNASADVLNAIPHREPFLFVDSIIESADNRIVVKKTFNGDEDFFRGNYPGNPLMPGVLIVEAALQAGAILVSNRIGSVEKKSPVVTRIADARFKTPVRPGDVLIIEAKMTEEIGRASCRERV